MKLKDGAFNLGEALANQSSKGAKEKLQEVRGEQKELVEVRWDWGLDTWWKRKLHQGLGISVEGVVSGTE